MNDFRRRALVLGIAGLSLAAVVRATPLQRGRDQKDDDSQRPKLSLKAQPNVGLSPARIVLTAELSGGANDYQDFYCPTVSWDWDDGTESENTSDCDPYEAGKSAIKRRFTVEHVFRAGTHRIVFRLKRNEKLLASATVGIQIQAGASDSAR